MGAFKLMPTLPLLGTVWVLAFTFSFTGANAEEAPLPAVPWQPGPRRYLVSVPGVEETTLSLYPQDGVVGVATGDSLLTSLKDRNGAENWYFVELYDHMCPHCWYAVPIVTQVAGAFFGSPRWGMASLNCHMRSNAEVCFFLEIISGAMDYPTFLLCPPRGLMSEADSTSDPLSARAQGLLNNLAGEQRATFLDLRRCRMRYGERHVKAGQEDPFLPAQKISRWVVNKTGLQVMHSEKLTMGADFADKVAPNPRAAPGRPGWLRDDKEGAPGVPAWEPEQRWFDALRGFTSALYWGYRSERHQAAVASAEFLARTFPANGQALAKLAHELKALGPIAHPFDFQTLLMSWANRTGILNSGSSPIHTYITCDGSTCAMWTLLHVTLTAVAARGISHRNLHGDENITLTYDGNLLLETMTFVRTFVEAFLSCGPCKLNFIDDNANCEYGRCTITKFRELPLWLWRMHNAVSLRVAARHAAQVDRRWPMYEDCPTCWRQELVMGGQQARQLQEQQHTLTVAELDFPFHTNRVFWHMVRTYIGMNRVAFDVADLNHEEQEEVQAVLERERAIAAGKPIPHHPGRTQYTIPPSSTPPPVPHTDDRREGAVAGGNRMPHTAPPTAREELPPWTWPLRKFLLSLAALASGVVGLLCYHQCDLSKVAQTFGTLERTTRAPVIRSPEEGAPASADDDDGDLAE